MRLAVGPAGIVVWVALLTMPQCTLAVTTTTELFHKAFAFYRAGSLQLADTAYDQLIRQQREELRQAKLLAAALVNSGNIKRDRKDMRGAKARWAEVLEMKGLAGDVTCMALYSMGLVLFGEGEVRDGIERFERALKDECSHQVPPACLPPACLAFSTRGGVWTDAAKVGARTR